MNYFSSSKHDKGRMLSLKRTMVTHIQSRLQSTMTLNAFNINSQ